MPGADMGIDLGTSNTLIYLHSKGVMLNEPSVVAVDRWEDRVIAMGKKALELVGRTSERIEVIYPLSGGVISDYGLTEYMMLSYIKQVSNHAIFNPRIVICIPGKVTDVEKRALLDAAHAAGARRICLLEEAIAAAIGAGIDISLPRAGAVVDIGAGTSDMAVLSLGGIAVLKTSKTAGKTFDQELIQYMRKKYNLAIGSRMAEQAKIAIGCVAPLEQERRFSVKGRDLVRGLPRAVELSSTEMMQILKPVAMQIIKTVQDLLEETPPEMIGDLYEDGIALTGGGALLEGMDRLLEQETHLKVWVPEDPLTCVARGAGRAMYYLDHMRDNLGRMMNPLIDE